MDLSNNIKIISVKYAESFLPESMVFECGDKSVRCSIIFKIYLIETGARRILVDAGCETMPGFDMRNFISPIQVLSSMSISPSDITDVILTHAHHDHIECVSYFDKSTVYIQRDEYEKSGRKYIPTHFNTVLFEDEIEIVEGIRAIRIGGHSVGSCVVEITDKATVYVIAGDECYLYECIERGIPTGSSCCPEKSRAFIEKYSKEPYHVLLCHDEKTERN